MLRFGAVEHHLVINKDRTVPGEQLGAHYSLNSLRVSVTFYRSMEANLKCEQAPVDILRLPVDLQLRCCKGVHHNNLSVTVLGLPYLHPARLNKLLYGFRLSPVSNHHTPLQGSLDSLC